MNMRHDRPPAVDVSVIVPCYRAAEWLPAFLACLEAQRFAGTWEAVLVEDGDGCCSDVVERETVRVIRQEHRGVSAARNRGLAEARGRILMFADPDDLVAPDWIERMAAALDGVDMVWSGYAENGVSRTPHDAGCLVEGAAVRRRLWRAVFGYRLRDVFKVFLPGGLWTRCRREMAGVWRLAIRREALGEVRFDERLSLYEDAMFIAAVAARANRLRVVGDTGYGWQVRPTGAMTREANERMVANKFAVRDVRREMDPRMSRWRGTWLLTTFEILKKTRRLGPALRYALFMKFA